MATSTKLFINVNRDDNKTVPMAAINKVLMDVFRELTRASFNAFDIPSHQWPRVPFCDSFDYKTPLLAKDDVTQVISETYVADIPIFELKEKSSKHPKIEFADSFIIPSDVVCISRRVFITTNVYCDSRDFAPDWKDTVSLLMGADIQSEAIIEHVANKLAEQLGLSSMMVKERISHNDAFLTKPEDKAA